MSEEEIINILSDEIVSLNVGHEKYEQAVKGLLDLYNKEKEKNKELEDKIKATIEEVEQWELYNMKIPKLSTLDERLGAKIGIKYILQSLLAREE